MGLQDLFPSFSGAGLTEVLADYNIGDYVIYNDLLYRCATTIGTSGETWTSGHWTQVNIGSLIKQLFNQFT